MTIAANSSPNSPNTPPLVPIMPGAQASGAGAAGATGAPDAYSGMVTPDSLMAYCEARLSDLNRQMNAIFQEQQTDNAFVTDVDNALTAFNKYSGGINVTGGVTVNNDPNLSQLNGTLTTLQGEAPPGSPAATAIQNALTTLNTGNDDQVTPDEIKSIVQDLQGVVNDQNSNSQLEMINLQSLMSQQQTAVQLTTNLVQALDQQMQAIATNIGK